MRVPQLTRSDLRGFKVSHQIINDKTVQVHSTLHCTLFFFMIAFEHTAQHFTENDLVTAESQLVIVVADLLLSVCSVIFLISLQHHTVCNSQNVSV